MPFGTRLSLGEQFLLQSRYEFGVFAVRGDDHSEALCEFERLVHFAVIDTEKVLVSEKNLKRRRSVGNDLSQLRFCFFHKLRHRHVKGIVTRALAISFRFPKLITSQRIIVAAGAAHFDIRCCSTDERRNAAGFVRVLGERGHEREIDVNVRIDEAWKDQFAGGVNHFRVWRSVEIFTDARDGLVFDIDVRLNARSHGHDFAISNQQGHLHSRKR